jgi:hypothetical protein
LASDVDKDSVKGSGGPPSPNANARAQEALAPGANDSTVRLLPAVVVVFGLAACTHNDYIPNVVQITPSGTPSAPAPVSIQKSFTLIAVEDGYTGEFTAQTIVGKCWVVQSPVTTSGAWIVVPQGQTCSSDRDVEQIRVKDTNGHSAVTYIRST